MWAVAARHTGLITRGRADCRATSFAPTARRALVTYAWPGNVQILEHVIERATALAPHSILSHADLSDEVKGKQSDGNVPVQNLPGTHSGALFGCHLP